jgi:hypothetical protein
MTRGYAGNDVGRMPRILAKYAVSDAVTFASLAEGSLKNRRFLL